MNYNKADFIASYGISSQLPESDRPELSFSGRSNVGKSSLINKLCSRKNLARVSSTPGKTATINFYSVDDCYFVDLPGYGYAKVSNADRERWDDLINSYFEAQRHHTLQVHEVAVIHRVEVDGSRLARRAGHAGEILAVAELIDEAGFAYVGAAGEAQLRAVALGQLAGNAVACNEIRFVIVHSFAPFVSADRARLRLCQGEQRRP